MTQREQGMLKVLLGILGVVVVGGAFYFALLRPLATLSQEEEQVQDSLGKKEMILRSLITDRKLIHLARERSLPVQPHQAAIEYGDYLRALLKNAGLVDVNFQGPTNLDTKPLGTGAGAKAKKATQTVINFTVRAKGNFGQVVKTLESMQTTPVMHRVKKLSLDRIDMKDTEGRLSVNLEVEALILHNIPSDHKPTLTATPKMDPPGTNASREYAMLSKRNFFLGYIPPAPPPQVAKAKKDETPEVPEDPPDPFDVREYVRLEHTIPSNEEAYFRNVATADGAIRIRPTPGFSTIKIYNENRKRVLVQGKVLRVDQRDVYFSVGEDIYGWHIGHSIAQAMRRPLSTAELREIGLLKAEKKTTKTAGETPASEEAAGP